ncbi:MAG: oxygen-independent coproporphyrinogen III oxidase [Parvularculaceae bacterium]
MNPAWTKYLNSRAPRYTSYPSALAFSDATGADAYEQALGEIGFYEPISIYVHIPFCQRLCWYCGCNMRVENRYERARDYVERLCDEARLVSAALGGAGKVTSVHFGGGTPNYLEIKDLGRILDCIEIEFGLTDGARLDIELDPRLLRAGDIEGMAGLGFSRMSLGVQDFNPDVQKAINRIQSFELIEATVAAMRAADISDISFDLIYGLPRQTEDSFAETVEQSIALGADRFSVFGYAHLPSALKHQQMIKDADLPDQAARARLAMMVDQMFIDARYRRVGFDHYARPDNALVKAMQRGQLHRNFQGFTDDGANATIGLGASAISKVGGLYSQNAKDIARYGDMVARGALATAKGVRRTERDCVVAALVENLLCAGRADASALFSMLPAPVVAQMRQNLEAFARDGVISLDGTRIDIAAEAWVLRRAVAASIDPALEAARTYSAAV